MSAPKMTAEKKERMFWLLDNEPGLSYAQIAERLWIHSSSIRYHIKTRKKAERLPRIKEAAAARAEVMP